MATIFQPDDDKNKEQTDGMLDNALTQTSASGGVSAPPSISSTGQPQARPKGSGRFTNVQKYLQANQAGGQQVAGGIGQRIGGEIDEQQQKAQKYYQGVREGIQQGQQTAQQGGQFLQQLEGIGQNIQQSFDQNPNSDVLKQDFGDRGQGLDQIQQFTESPNFGQFQAIQAGRGIDEGTLGVRQRQLQDASQRLLGTTQQRAEQLGTEGGRFDLLQETFGGNVNPQYNRGQQRLDQLFLARQGLQPLQQQVSQSLTGARDLTRGTRAAGADINRLVAQEQNLMDDISQQASANEQAYIDMLSSYIPEVNQARQAEWEDLQARLASYRPATGDQVQTGVVRPGLTSEQLERLGLDPNQQTRVYNVLRNLQGAEDIARRGQEAQSFQDIAEEADVNRYRALAQIAGISPEEMRLREAGNLGKTYTAREGEASLMDRIQRAAQEFSRQKSQVDFNRSGVHNFRDTSGGKWLRPGGGMTRTYEFGADSNFQDLLDRGRDAISTYTRGREQWRGIPYAQMQADAIWQDFQNLLSETGYRNVVGGQPQTQGKDLGYQPGMGTLPVGSTVKNIG